VLRVVANGRDRTAALLPTTVLISAADLAEIEIQNAK
jgi:hypothetical protein